MCSVFVYYSWCVRGDVYVRVRVCVGVCSGVCECECQ